MKANIPFHLVCTINGPSSTEASVSTLFAIDQNMTLVVEDEDDNPPRLQNPNEQQIVDVYLKGQGIIQVKKINKYKCGAAILFPILIYVI